MLSNETTPANSDSSGLEEGFSEEVGHAPAQIKMTWASVVAKLQRGLMVKGCQVEPGDLAFAVKATVDCFCNNRSSDKERHECRWFTSKLMPGCYEAVLSDEYLARLVSLPSEALALRASLLHLLNLLVVFAAECRSTPGAADPASCFAASARTFSAVLLRCSAAAEQLASLQAVVHEEDGVDSSRARQQQGPWGEQLARAFVVEGAQFCLELLDAASVHSMVVMEAALLVISRTSGLLQGDATLGAAVPKDKEGTILDALVSFLDTCLDHDLDKLSLGGTDKTFSAFSRIVELLYLAGIDVLTCEASANSHVCPLQRHFVEVNLKAGGLPKQLSAVRECSNMLARAAAIEDADPESSLEAHAEWLDAESSERGSLLKQMLCTDGLHQRQYADLVLSILRCLSTAELLHPRHLDLLWAATEQEGVHEEIRVNVYNVIQGLASDPGLSPEHLDELLNKIEEGQRLGRGRTLADTLHLMQLLRKLAESDDPEDDAVVQRLLHVAWQLTVTPTVPLEVLKRNLLPDLLLNVYKDQERTKTYAYQCLKQLPGCGNVGDSDCAYAALHVLHKLVSRGKLELVEWLETVPVHQSSHGVHEVLVHSLSVLVQEAQALAAASPAAASASPQRASPVYTNEQTVQRLVACIRRVAEHSPNFYPLELAERLWSLLLQPASPQRQALHISLALDFITAPAHKRKAHGDVCACEGADYLEPDAWRLLLAGCMAALQPQALSHGAWECFRVCFIKANEQALQQGVWCLGPLGLGELQGLPWVWEVALSCEQLEVSEAARALLLRICSDAAGNVGEGDEGPEATVVEQQEGTASTAVLAGDDGACLDLFVRECVQRLAQLLTTLSLGGDNDFPALAGLPVLSDIPTQVSALTQLQRLLTLLATWLEVRQGRTLPPLPSHRSSYRGLTVPLEVTVISGGRDGGRERDKRRFLAHLNEYVGTVRRRLASILGCEPWRLKLSSGGGAGGNGEGGSSGGGAAEEWASDAQMLSQAQDPFRGFKVTAALTRSSNGFARPGNVAAWMRSSAVAALSRIEHVHERLLQVADLTAEPAAGSTAVAVRRQAMRLLQLLPTSSDLLAALRRELGRQQGQEQAEAGVASTAAGLWDLVLGLGLAQDRSGAEPTARPRPAHVLYALQALSGLLFPPQEMAPRPEQEAGVPQHATEQAEAAQAGTLGRAIVCGTTVASAVLLPLLSRVLDWVQGAQEQQQRQQHAASAAPSASLHSRSSWDMDVDAAEQEILEAGYCRELTAVVVPLVARISEEALRRQNQQQQQGEEEQNEEREAAGQEGEAGGHGEVSPPQLQQQQRQQQLCDAAASMPSPSGTAHLLSSRLALSTPSDSAASNAMPEQPVLAVGSSSQDPTVGPLTQDGGAAAAVEAGTMATGTGHSAGATAAASPSPGGVGSTGAGEPLGMQGTPAAPPGPMSGIDAYAATMASTGPRPAADDPAALLASAVSLLVQLVTLIASQPLQPAARGFGQLALGKERTMDGWTDSQLVREALEALAPLTEQPQLRETFLADPRSESMVAAALLHPSTHPLHNPLRQFTASFLRSTLLASKDPAAYTWLLRLLAKLHQQRQVSLASAPQFFLLLKEVLHNLPEGDAAARGIAESLLLHEVASLRTSAAAVAAGLPTGAADERRGGSSLLPYQLLLVLELVKALDVLAVSAGDGGMVDGLVELLLSSYLFPEAAALARPSRSVADMQATLRLVRHCCDQDPRKAAMQLLILLLTGSPTNWEVGHVLLEQLHFKQGPIVNDHLLEMDGGLRSAGAYVGLQNGGATCYMNAVLQQLFMQPRLRSLILGARPVPAMERKDSMFHQLQLLFAHLACGEGGSYYPCSFWLSYKDYDGAPINVLEHQDAYEFFNRLQECVDQHLVSTGQAAAMKQVLGGKFAQQIVCKDIDYRSEREEDFLQISVDVKGKGTLEKSLESYVQGELMEGDNAYELSRGQRVTALRRTCLSKLPHTLVIHLKRFEFDHLTMQRFKVREYFEFPVTLDLYPFTAAGLAAGERAEAQPAADSASSSRSGYEYELKGIVVHSGTAFAGHYYSLVKERPQAHGAEGGRWLRFDDTTVREWSLDHLEDDCFGGTPSASSPLQRPNSAYMLFYEPVTVDGHSCDEAHGGAASTHQQEQREVALQGAHKMSLDGLDGAGGSGSGEAGASGADARAAAAIPFGMPLELYESVLLYSVVLAHNLRVDCKEYRAWMKALVEGRAEAGTEQGGRRKSRRRLGGECSAAGAGSGSSSGSAGPEDPSPAGAGTAGTVAPGPSSSVASGSAPASAAPSSQRGEELELAACQSAKLATQYVQAVLLPSLTTNASEATDWLKLLERLISARGPAVGMSVLQAVLDQPECLRHCLAFGTVVVAQWFWDAMSAAVRSIRIRDHSAGTACAPDASVSALYSRLFAQLGQLGNDALVQLRATHKPPFLLRQICALAWTLVGETGPGGPSIVGSAMAASSAAAVCAADALVQLTLELSQCTLLDAHCGWQAVHCACGFLLRTMQCPTDGLGRLLGEEPEPSTPSAALASGVRQQVQLLFEQRQPDQLLQQLLSPLPRPLIVTPGKIPALPFAQLVRALMWDNQRLSVKFITAICDVLAFSHNAGAWDEAIAVEFSEGVWNDLIQAAELVLSCRDSWFVQRAHVLCFGGNGCRLCLSALLAVADDNSLAQMGSLWVIGKLAEEVPAVAAGLEDWVRTHRALTERLAQSCLGGPDEEVQMGRRGEKEVDERYTEVGYYLMDYLGRVGG